MTPRLFIVTAVAAAIILAAAIKTVFGQPPAADLSVYYQAQRNSAMDLVAQCSAANAELHKRIAELEKQVGGK